MFGEGVCRRKEQVRDDGRFRLGRWDKVGRVVDWGLKEGKVVVLVKEREVYYYCCCCHQCHSHCHYCQCRFH